MHIKDVWNRFLLLKQTDETIQFPGETKGSDILHDSNPNSQNNKESLQSYWTKQMQKGSTDRNMTFKNF